MTSYAFPRDLLKEVKSRWKAFPIQQFTLPEDRILQRLLETCYHASFRTSEQRAVECVVAYVSAADIPEEVLQLARRPIELTDSELVRLAPVTQRRQTVIGCELVGEWLCIWGFFDYGHAWVQHSIGDPPAIPMQPTDFPPDCLTITIEGPGALTVSRGRNGLVRLRGGRVVFPQDNLLQSAQNPLGRFFRQVTDGLASSDRYNVTENTAQESSGQRALLGIYTTSIQAILDRIRLRQHGGSVVIARLPINPHHAHVTYAVSEHSGLARDMLAYKALDDRLREPHANSSTLAELERCRVKLELQRTSRSLIRGISQISLLAAVDGAVLLDDHLRLQGFGVRFPLMLSPETTVMDAATGVEYLCDQWGLRHQSVFSICANCEQAVGLIVSQDGEVKAVMADGSRLCFWDGILD